MAYNFRWFDMPGNRIVAKIDVAAGLQYVVNFIKEDNDTYACFFYPSVTSQNNMFLKPTKATDDRSIQERIYQNLRNVLAEFVEKYKPADIVFSTQFQFDLNKITSSTVPGYNLEFTSGGRPTLKKG